MTFSRFCESLENGAKGARGERSILLRQGYGGQRRGKGAFSPNNIFAFSHWPPPPLKGGPHPNELITRNSLPFALCPLLYALCFLMSTAIKVIAPASLSNLACGFDILGLALDIPGDEIIGRVVDTPGVHIKEITGHKRNIPTNPAQNIASVAATALLKHLGEESRGIELRIRKNIPAGSGMGSSASSAVAAVVLVNELLKNPLEKRELVPFAIKGEIIASGNMVGDNVVASMIGGLVLIRDIQSYDYHRIYMPPGLCAAVLLPDITITTTASRAILRAEVPLTNMVRQSANLGGFITGMHNGDLDLIRRSMVDLVIEPQRKSMIPHFDQLQQTAMQMGALGCSISGAGPAVFALCQEKLQATDIAAAMLKIYTDQKMEAKSYVAGISHEGAVLK